MQLSKELNKKHFTHLIPYVKEDDDIAAYGTSGTSLGSNDEDLDIVAVGDEAIDPSFYDDPFDPRRAFDIMIIDKLLNICHLSSCFKLYYLMS